VAGPFLHDDYSMAVFHFCEWMVAVLWVRECCCWCWWVHGDGSCAVGQGVLLLLLLGAW
jgi:hypothetical protein